MDKNKPVPPLRALKNLCEEKPEVGEEIWAWTEDGVSSQEDVRDCIARRHGITLPFDSKLSEWRSWWRAKRLLEAGTTQTIEVLEWWRTNRPNATPEDLRAAQFLAMKLRAEAEGDKEFQLEVLKAEGKDLDRGLNARRVAVQEARTKAAAAVKDAGKKVQLTPDQIKEVLEAVDKRILGIE